MLTFSPLVPLLLGVFFSILIVRDSIIRRKFLKKRIIFSFIFIFITALLSVFRDNILSVDSLVNIYNYTNLILTIFIAVMFLFNGLSNIVNNELNDSILQTFGNNMYYLYLDKKNNILAISNELKEALNIDKEVNNFNEILDNYITIKNINDKASSNQEFIYYLNYKETEPRTADFKIQYYLNDGKLREVNLVEQLLFSKDKYVGRIFLGQNKTIIENVDTNNDKLLNERLKYLLNPPIWGLILINLENNRIYVNDYLVDKLGLKSNDFAYSDYVKLIDKDDYNAYKDNLERVKDDNYEFIYRISNGYKMIYVKESGNIIYDGTKKIELIANVVINETRNFMTTDTILDKLAEENEMIVKINDLANHNENYELVYFRMTNIPSINEQYKRQIGTLVMEEYVKTFTKVFADNIYRISGLDFVMLITDIRKMELFKKTILNGKIFNPNLNYGAINCKLEVNMGISFSNDAIRPNDVYLNSKKALEIAITRNIPYLFYKDINR